MDWLVLWFAIEIGIIPSAQIVPPDGIAYEEAYCFTSMESEVEILDTLYVGGGVWTRFWDLSGHTYAPDATVYYFSAGIRWGWLDFGYKHECSHRVLQPCSVGNWSQGAIDSFSVQMSNRR